MTTGTTRWRESFAALARSLGQFTKQPDKANAQIPPDKPWRIGFKLEDTDFEIVHSDPGADRFHLICRLGKLPANNAQWHCRQALLANHVLADAHTAMLAIDRDSDELVYSSHVALASTIDAQAFLKGLEEIAQGALAWRRLAAHTPSPAAAHAAPVMPLEDGTSRQPCPHRTRLLALLRELPAAHGLEWRKDKPLPPPDISESERFVLGLHFGQQRFDLAHSKEKSIAPFALLRCYFGTPPADRTAQSHRRLLELNHEMATQRTCAFSIDPLSGQVVHGCGIRLESTSANSLFGVMNQLAELALSWRHDQFLGAAPTPSKPVRQAAGVGR